ACICRLAGADRGEELLRKVGHGDGVSSAHQHDKAFDEVTQLSNIAWPTVFCEGRHDVRLEFFHRPVVTFGHTTVKVLHQAGDVCFSFTQWRDQQEYHRDISGQEQTR